MSCLNSDLLSCFWMAHLCSLWDISGSYYGQSRCLNIDKLEKKLFIQKCIKLNAV